MRTGDHRPELAAFTAITMPVKRLYTLKQVMILLCLWLVVIAVYTGATIRIGLQQATRELDTAGFTLHRVISQLTAQHDAHLTSLSALINSATPPPEAAIRQVSQNILKFYPRIASIDLVALPYVSAGTSTQISVPDEVVPVDYAWIADLIDRQPPGRVYTYVKPGMPSVYFLAKRTSAANNGLAVVMQIDARQLLDDQAQYAYINLLLSLNGRTILQQRAQDKQTQAFVLAHPRFSRVIDNQSQPFALHIDKPIYLQDVLHVTSVAIVAAVSLLVLLALHFAWQQRNRVRALQLSAQKAEQRARLLEHETRLAHASRVNALGEMASGIAHELTQPLTALLSQSQAIVRLVAQASPDKQLLAQALDANVREAKRAGAMLKRMRDYMSNTPPTPTLTSVNQVANDVAALTQTDLVRRHIRLILQLDTNDPHAVVDVIEMEQVLHNLVRNAADALDDMSHADKTITLSTGIDEDNVIVHVRDNGAGIADEVVPRLFEPFFTTKQDGMGLGLSLCATLVERVGGHIAAHNHLDGGAVFTVRLPLQQQVEVV
jgi:two-component system sensor kinase FixL